MWFNSEEIFSSKNFQPDPFCKIILPSKCGSTWQKKCKASRQLEWIQIECNGQASSELDCTLTFLFLKTWTQNNNCELVVNSLERTDWIKIYWVTCEIQRQEKKKNHWDLQKSAQAKECILKYYPSENTNQRKLETFNSFQTISTLKFTEGGLFWVI